MRIFVTGGSGFIGQHIVPLLIKDKHELLILRRKTMPQLRGEIDPQIILGDLKNLNSIQEEIIRFNPEVCLHLAWEGIPDFSYQQCQSNLVHSMNLIQMLVEKTACHKIIVSGSSWEYGKTQGVCHEDDATAATNFFTWAKNTVYTGGSLLCGQKSIDFVWLRIFFAFGPGQKMHALIPTLYTAYKMGQKPDIKNPSNAQDFIDVRDVAEAFRLAVKKPLKSGAYNIGRETPVSVADICHMVERQLLNKTLTVKKNTVNNTTSSTVYNWADTTQFRLATAWQPRISMEEGIKNQIEFLERT